MSEEFFSNNQEFIDAHVPKDEYIPGSAAPKIAEPTKKPDIHLEPEQKPKPEPKPKEHRPTYRFSSLLTVLGVVIVALCAFFLLTREVQIQQQKDKILETKQRIEELYNQRDSLAVRYNSAIDLDNIRADAASLGMHTPKEGQIVKMD